MSVRGSFRLSEKNLFNGCTYQKMLVYKVVTFLKGIKMAVLFLIFLDQISPKWIKLDQNGSKWISHQSKKCYYKKVVIFTKRIKMAVLFWIFLDQIHPKWIKLDQT